MAKKRTFNQNFKNKTMKKIKSQKAAIFSLLLSGQKLDLFKAFRLTGSMKLSTRVSEFNKYGCDIRGKEKVFKTKYGTTGTLMVYKLKPNKASRELAKFYKLNVQK